MYTANNKQLIPYAQSLKLPIWGTLFICELVDIMSIYCIFLDKNIKFLSISISSLEEKIGIKIPFLNYVPQRKMN